jgi:hypothetical protein
VAARGPRLPATEDARPASARRGQGARGPSPVRARAPAASRSLRRTGRPVARVPRRRPGSASRRRLGVRLRPPERQPDYGRARGAGPLERALDDGVRVGQGCGARVTHGGTVAARVAYGPTEKCVAAQRLSSAAGRKGATTLRRDAAEGRAVGAPHTRQLQRHVSWRPAGESRPLHRARARPASLPARSL